MAKNYRLNDPYFNEFVFHCILNAPPDLRNKLPIELLKYTTSVEKMKGFAERASLERKLEMIARLGGAFSLAVHPPGYLSQDKLKQVLENYLSDKRLEDVDEMIKEKVFVITNREIMAIHSIMAMNCHSPTYMLNRDYDLIASQITSGAKSLRVQDIEMVKVVMEDHKLLCKFILYNIIHQNFVDDLNGYKVRELLVLIYLFINRNKYVESKEIQDFLSSTYSPQVISSTVFRLAQSKHLDQFPKTFRYAISGLGVQVVATYINRILNLTLSF